MECDQAAYLPMRRYLQFLENHWRQQRDHEAFVERPLASSFWDETTMIDLGTILERRLNGGIRVDFLIRSLV
jgi:hypothetical protein